MVGVVHGRGHVWQEGVCGRGDLHGRGACIAEGVFMAGGMHGRRDSHCSGQYASYWHAFLFNNFHQYYW